MAENQSWVTPEESRRLADELHQWFKDRAFIEAGLAAPKAIEYGQRSMVAQGKGLAELGGWDVTDREAFELAVWDMIKLKVGRWTEAIMHAKPVSDDTLLDIGIYIKMVQRFRDAGGWPGTPKPAAGGKFDGMAYLEQIDTSTISDPPLTFTAKHDAGRPKGNPFIDNDIR